MMQKTSADSCKINEFLTVGGVNEARFKDTYACH